MTTDKTVRQNRIRAALGRIYETQPEHFQDFLRRYQEDPTGRVFAPLADLYRQMGRLEEAIELCLQGLLHHPDFQTGRVVLARCYLDKKSYSEAREALQTVVKAFPDNLLAQKLLGETLLNLGDEGPALQALKMAQRLSPSDTALAEKINQLEKQKPFGSPPPPSIPEFVAPSQPPVPKSDEIGIPSPLSPRSPVIENVIFDEPMQEPMEEDSNDDNIPLNDLLGFQESQETFTATPLAQVFKRKNDPGEITTQTLGDLYFSQGQYDRALKIFEQVQNHRPNPDIEGKMDACRQRLGVGANDLLKQKKIDTLRKILHGLQSSKHISSV